MSSFWVSLWHAITPSGSPELKKEKQKFHETTIITQQRLDQFDKEWSKATRSLKDLEKESSSAKGGNKRANGRST